MRPHPPPGVYVWPQAVSVMWSRKYVWLPAPCNLQGPNRCVLNQREPIRAQVWHHYHCACSPLRYVLHNVPRHDWGGEAVPERGDEVPATLDTSCAKPSTPVEPAQWYREKNGERVPARGAARGIIFADSVDAIRSTCMYRTFPIRAETLGVPYEPSPPSTGGIRHPQSRLPS